jgi:tetratricopeptide (TPR) repeat protein
VTISAALIVLAAVLPPPTLPQAQHEAVALSADQAFAAADQLVAAGNKHDAEVLLRALSKDPSKQLRSEARFRLGRLRAAAGDYRGAIIWYRAVLDEEPGAAPVRLELARTYARLGEGAAAARELRRAQATRLPLDVARQVDRISTALRSSAPYGFDVSVGIAPDSNINRATAARTIDAQGLTLVIDRNGRATSGIGVQLNGSGYSRLPLGGSSTWLIEASGSALLYSSGRYDDVAATVAIGPEFRSAVAQLRPAILISRRSFDGRRLSDQAGGSIEGRRNVGPTTQLAATANATYARYRARAYLDGFNYSLSVAVEKAVTSRFFGLVGLSGARSDARDPAYATTSFGGRIFTSRDAGRFTIFGGASYQHLASDAVFTLFQRRRRDDYSDLQLGASARLLAVRGLIPAVKFSLSQNRSTIPFYAFHRNRLELSLSRQF